MEMELKLLLDPAARARVESHPAFQGARRLAGRHQLTTYFDTPDHALNARGACVRMRRQDDGRFIQTVKVTRSGDALGLRREWEWPVASADLDLARFDTLPEDAAWIRDAVGALRPLFASDVRRDIWMIDLDGGTEVEAVIDAGLIRAGTATSPVSELELELKAGTSAPVFALARDLAEHAGLRYGTQSKAERGYALIGAEPYRAAATPLHDGVTLGEAFPRLLAAALGDMAGEIPAAARGDVEGVHRMRAALRKLRTLLVLFAPAIDRDAAARFNDTLRDLGTVLGHGRDWDVFVTETLAEARRDLDRDGLDRLAQAAGAARAQAHAAISETLNGPVPTRLILGLGAWTADRGWVAATGRDARPDAPLRALAPDLLERLDRRVRKRARHAGSLDPDDLHALRKAMKKLRYGVEDVGALFKPKPVRHTLKSIKAVLSLLGAVNDASVTQARLKEIEAALPPAAAEAADALAHWCRERRDKALGKLKGKLDDALDEERFWR